MSQTDKYEDFERRLRRRMSTGSAGLDGATLSKLNQARQAALAELERPGWLALPGWLPAGGAVAAAMMVALLVRQGLVPAEVPDRAAAEDIEILLSGEELDLYEDLEFYAWLEMQPEVG